MTSLLPWIKNSYKALVPVIAGAVIALANAVATGSLNRVTVVAIVAGVVTGIATYWTKNVPLPPLAGLAETVYRPVPPVAPIPTTATTTSVVDPLGFVIPPGTPPLPPAP